MISRYTLAVLVLILFVAGCGNDSRKNIVDEIGDSYSEGTTNVVLKINPEVTKEKALELFLDKVQITSEGVFLEVKDDIRKSAVILPIYFNKNFKGNQIFIPVNADLSQYRLEKNKTLSESELYSQNEAFLFASPISSRNRQGLLSQLNIKNIQRKENYTYRLLYLSKIENNKAIFKYYDSFKSSQNGDPAVYNYHSFRVTEKLP